MTFEKFRLKASILKTSILIFGIKNTLNFKRLFSLPEEASFPRRKYNSIDTDDHNLAVPWIADRRRQIPKKDLLRSKQCGLEVTYKFITHFNTDFASQPFPVVFRFCYSNQKYDMSVVSLSYLPVCPLQLFALNQTGEDRKLGTQFQMNQVKEDDA